MRRKCIHIIRSNQTGRIKRPVYRNNLRVPNCNVMQFCFLEFCVLLWDEDSSDKCSVVLLLSAIGPVLASAASACWGRWGN